jgi:hypothetical protein
MFGQLLPNKNKMLQYKTVILSSPIQGTKQGQKEFQTLLTEVLLNATYATGATRNHAALCSDSLGYSKGYSKALEYEYKVKIAALGTLKQYSIFSLTLYLE